MEAAAGTVALPVEDDVDDDDDAGASSLGVPNPLGLVLLAFALADITTNGDTDAGTGENVRSQILLLLECRRCVGTKAATLGAQKYTTKGKTVVAACLIWC